MKTKLLLPIFFSIFFLNARAQTSVYHPFPDSNAVWNVILGMWGSCADENVEKYSYTINGDTIINSIPYHKLFINNYQLVNGCFLPFNNKGLQACYRQDTIAKKVYVIPLRISNAEQLLYDFNLMIGDTLHGFAEDYFCRDTKIVVGIDSVLIGNNFRKRWLINVPSYSDTMNIIEGIGSTKGLLTEIPCGLTDEPQSQLICFRQNNKTLYPDTMSLCDIIDQVNNLSEDALSISISPNPLTSTSTLHLTTQPTNAEAIIYSILGKEMLRKSFSGNEVQIEKGKMESGVYFVKVHPVVYLSNGVKAGEKEFVQKLIVE